MEEKSGKEGVTHNCQSIHHSRRRRRVQHNYALLVDFIHAGRVSVGNL